MNTNRRISEALQQVKLLDELHGILETLAQSETARWNRSQVMYYLPDRWRASAARYFEGERLRGLDALPAKPAVIAAPSLVHALATANIALERRRVDVVEVEEAPVRMLASHELLQLAEPEGDGPVANMQRALRAEIKRVEADRPRRFRLRNGRCVRSSGGSFCYKFAWSSEPDPFAPGRLKIGNELTSARVGEFDPNADRLIEIIVEEYVGAEIPSAEFLVDPSYLLRVLHEEIRHRDDASGAVEETASALCQSPREPFTLSELTNRSAEGLNEQQVLAIRTATSTSRSYVWGPPGTGKTTTVGALVRSLVDAGKRVLVVSPYNVAVDQAILAIAKDSTVSPLRFGRAGEEVRHQKLDMESQLEDAAAKSGALAIAQSLVASTMAGHAGQLVSPPSSMRACLDEIGAWVAASDGSRADPHIQELTSVLRRLRAEFRRPEDQILASSRAVGCTMALSFVSQRLREANFDHIVVDEASVVRAPEALLISLLGRGASITFFGDPKQLPPIVLDDTHHTRLWLGRNPFGLAGIEAPEDATHACVMLKEQHRMAPPIRSLISTLFYKSSLRDGARAPASGRVVAISTSESGARSTPKMINLSNSKENLVHRHLVVEAIRALREQSPHLKILVLSPFKAQKRAYRTERISADLGSAVRFETIHSSQGSEEDIVIIDFVLAGAGPGSRSRMLDDVHNASLPNLLNVAMSRARQQLILVADFDLARKLAPAGLWVRTLDMARKHGEYYSAPKDRKLRRLLSSRAETI